MQLPEAINEFMISCKADGLKESTVGWYQSLLKPYSEHHAAKLVGEVRPGEMRQYIISIRQSEYSEDTKYAVIKTLHRFWSWAAAEYQIANPMSNIKYPAQPKPSKSKAAHMIDAQRLLDYTSGDDLMSIRDRAIVAFLIATGARAAGVCGLQRWDVDTTKRRAMVTEKGNKTRVVFFDPETAADLQRWEAARHYGAAPFFYNLKSGKALTTSGLLQLMYRLGQDAGCTGHVNPHAWRHAFGYAARRGMMDSINLSELMGHEDVETSKRYAQFEELDDLQEVYDQHAPRLRIKTLQK